MNPYHGKAKTIKSDNGLHDVHSRQTPHHSGVEVPEVPHEYLHEWQDDDGRSCQNNSRYYLGQNLNNWTADPLGSYPDVLVRVFPHWPGVVWLPEKRRKVSENCGCTEEGGHLESIKAREMKPLNEEGTLRKAGNGGLLALGLPLFPSKERYRPDLLRFDLAGDACCGCCWSQGEPDASHCIMPDTRPLNECKSDMHTMIMDSE